MGEDSWGGTEDQWTYSQVTRKGCVKKEEWKTGVNGTGLSTISVQPLHNST